MSRFRNLNAYDRHKLIINDYVLNRPGRTKLLQRDTSRDKRDIDVIRENHKFLWEDDDQEETWEQQLAKKYYDKLFKEYCISDLTKYKENKVALRWRTEAEVINGKGQFSCGNKVCSINEELRSWEVNFKYTEEECLKNALVKLRLCPDCSRKLNYRSQKREIKRMKKCLKKKRKHRSSVTSEQQPDDDDDLELKTEPESMIDNDDNQSETNNDSDEETEIVNEEDPNEDGGVWAAKKDEETKPDREQEFEKYLEDLLF